ncbi:MAG: heme-binding domain-containing protein [Algoriphagus sp.]|uniref:heme-binding domain-containing protein n=1 Tax=Algoriphagus sp. TaxID=1872435 RepID=UPI0017B65B11|nr:heme-binding domain-containing protein [Algoriphagus sp.]NVJ87712.1 heme-binding domain-containing protein [Algoriphagus sp.]
MNKIWKYIGIGLVVILLALQLIPNELPPVQTENPAAIDHSPLLDPEVATIFKSSCYDCHSNETDYPWYSHVVPVSWLVAKDIREGREELNFSEWENYDPLDQLAILDDIYGEVEEEEMPLPIYTMIHWEARIGAFERQKIMDWAERSMDEIAEKIE